MSSMLGRGSPHLTKGWLTTAPTITERLIFMWNCLQCLNSQRSLTALSSSSAGNQTPAKPHATLSFLIIFLKYHVTFTLVFCLNYIIKYHDSVPPPSATTYGQRFMCGGSHSCQWGHVSSVCTRQVLLHSKTHVDPLHKVVYLNVQVCLILEFHFDKLFIYRKLKMFQLIWMYVVIILSALYVSSIVKHNSLWM